MVIPGGRNDYSEAKEKTEQESKGQRYTTGSMGFGYGVKHEAHIGQRVEDATIAGGRLPKLKVGGGKDD